MTVMELLKCAAPHHRIMIKDQSRNLLANEEMEQLTYKYLGLEVDNYLVSHFPAFSVHGLTITVK